MGVGGDTFNFYPKQKKNRFVSFAANSKMYYFVWWTALISTKDIMRFNSSGCCKRVPHPTFDIVFLFFLGGGVQSHLFLFGRSLIFPVFWVGRGSERPKSF